MSNDAQLPIPTVTEAVTAPASAEPAAPIHPADAADAALDASIETPVTEHDSASTPDTTDSPELTDTPESTDAPVVEEVAGLSPEEELANSEPLSDPTTDEASPAPDSVTPETTDAAEVTQVNEVTEVTAAGEPGPALDEAPAVPEALLADAPAPAAAPEGATESTEAPAPAEAPQAGETGAASAPSLPAGVDVELITSRMAEVVTELETIAVTPDVDEAGKHPDDRALTDRARTLEDTWRTLIGSGVQAPELRARQTAARNSYAAARSRRAEMRGVDRARAGETKRALLVEAFALAQLAQGTSLSQLAGRRVGDEAPAVATTSETDAHAETAPAHADDAAAADTTGTTDAPGATDSGPNATDSAPSADTEAPNPDAIADDVVAADVSIADTALSPEAEAAEDAAIAPVDASIADTDTDTDIADVEAAGADDTATADGIVTTEGAATADDIAVDTGAAADDVAAASDVPASDATADDVAEIAVADGPTEPEAAPASSPVATSTPLTIDISAIARRARELQAEWTAAGFAGREVENELHPLFRRYMQVVFDLSRKESSAKSDARRALVTAARELADQAGDDVSNEAITRLVREAKNLQTQWKNGEAAPPAVESGAWRQFSGALRQVFAARERLAAGARVEREEIIAAVTTLASAKEPMRAMRDLGPLLRRWRESGPVTTPVYEALKLQLDRAAGTVRERADAERKRRDAEDAKSQGERAKNASKILREAERSGRGKRQERPAAQAQAQGALAAALAEAFGRAERVAEDVRTLERTVTELRERLRLAESGALESTIEEVATQQGFTVRRQTIDPGSLNPARLRAELAQAEQALGRRQSELQELTSNARGFGITA